MRFNFRFLLVGMMSFLYVSCDQKDDPIPVPDGEGERTVLVYIAADNNLGWDNNMQNQDGTSISFANSDYEEMKVGMLRVTSPDKHLLVYMDRWGDKPVLAELQNKNGKVVEKIVKTYEERNSTGKTETLEVFNDVFNNPDYQAESYGLVYWSHADGWIPFPVPSSYGPTTRWIGQDTEKGRNDNRMNLSDFVEILEMAPHFDFIMFDACFMQSIEVAYELRKYMDYYIGSPTENPGPGAPYDKVIPYLFKKTAAKAAAEAYFTTYESIYNGGDKISNENWTGGTSITVIKTSELDHLASVTKELLSGKQVSDVSILRTAFDYDKRSGSSHVGYYDMSQMMQQLLDDNAYSYWKQAFDASIAYWNTTPLNYSQYVGMFSMRGANGVTHYIPRYTTSAAAKAYHSTAWCKDVNLEEVGW